MPQPVSVFLKQSITLKAAIDDCLKDSKPKAVHKLRTSTRRIEATLELLIVATDLHIDREAKQLRKALRKLRRAAGAVRDLDVHRNLLKTCKRTADVKHLNDDLTASREKATRKLTQALESHQKKISKSLSIVEAALKPALDLDLSGKELTHLTRGWFAKSACTLDPEHDDQLHSIRKAGKTARYIAETGAETSKAAAALAARFERAQQTLGSWHDYLLLLDEAQTRLPKQSPTTEQIYKKTTDIRQKALIAAKQLLTTICAIPAQSGVH